MPSFVVLVVHLCIFSQCFTIPVCPSRPPLFRQHQPRSASPPPQDYSPSFLRASPPPSASLRSSLPHVRSRSLEITPSFLKNYHRTNLLGYFDPATYSISVRYGTKQRPNLAPPSISGAAIVTMARGVFKGDLLNIVYTFVTPFILTELTVSLEITISYVLFFPGLKLTLKTHIIQLLQAEIGPWKPTAPGHLVERLQSRKNEYRVTLGFIHATIRQRKCIVHPCQVRRQ